MVDRLDDPDAVSWEEVKRELGFTEDEREEIHAGAQALIAEARALRLDKVRHRQAVDTS